MGCFVRGGKSMWDVLSGVAEMAWDVLSGVTKKHGMFCRGWQIYVGCFIRGGKKWHGMFCPGMFCPAPRSKLFDTNGIAERIFRKR